MMIRKIEKESNETVAIIMDLQGPKIRIGVFENGHIYLRNGAKFVFDLEKDFGDAKRVPLPHPEVFSAILPGTDILLDDGKIKLKVMESNENRIETKVLIGGDLSNRKGVNIPNTFLPINSLTDKDLSDLKIANNVTADYVAVSFVQQAEDIIHARNLLSSDIKIIAKIEKPKAIENLDSIIEKADAIMVARGDLGVESPIEAIPSLQLKIVNKCREHKRPVIVATQILESMIQNPVPTRAEVSDIATAVYQGADAVMLSAETANGSYPIETVKVVDRVIRYIEQDDSLKTGTANYSDFAISGMLSAATKTGDIGFIATFTESGRAALDVAASRPNSFIIAMTPNARTVKQMCLVWGTVATLIEEVYSFPQMVQIVQKYLPELFVLNQKEKVAIVAGIPFRRSGTTNVLHFCEVSATKTAL
jgi:pyruvate kinase